MKRIIALAVAALLALPATVMAQEPLDVVGGKAVLTIVPETTYVAPPPWECLEGWTCYAPGEEPVCPECPEPPPCPDCPPPPVWECPVDWECIPPPEPPEPVDEHGFYVDTIQGSDVVAPDQLPTGEYYVRFDHPEWIALDLGYDVAAAPGVNRVWIEAAGLAANRENIYPYERMPRLTMFPVGMVELRAVVTWDDGTTTEFTEVVEIVNPSLPPDTVPPPGDSTFTPEPAIDVAVMYRDSTFTVSWKASPSEAVYDSIYYLLRLSGSNVTFPSVVDSLGWWRSGPIQCISSHTTCDGDQYEYIVEPVTHNPDSAVEVVNWCLTTQATKPDGLGLGVGVEECGQLYIDPLILFGWRSDMGRWLGSTVMNDTLPAGDYVFFLELRNRESWEGVDSVVIGVAEQSTIIAPREHVPMDANDGTVTFEPDKFYLLPYVVYGAGGNEFGVIEGRLVTVTIGPDLTGMLIPLDAPENIRFAKDTTEGPDSLLVGPLVIRWDESPQRSQGIQCEAPEWGTEDHCRPVNDPHINGDEVYSVLRVYDMVGTEIPLDRNPFGNIIGDGPGPFNNLNPWSIPIPIPDTIRACVQFQAWDCWNCVGPGGQIPPYINEWGNETRGVPLSEITCTTLEVQG
jgi:hypothetical protein